MLSIIRLWLFCACAAGLGAQAISSGQPAPVSIRFRLMAWDGNVPELAFGDNQKTQFVESGDRSAIMDYAGPRLISFTLPGAKPEQGVPPAVVASATLPLGATKVTLLTVPTKAGRFGMYPIAEDGGDIPAKHARLHNLSGVALRVIHHQNQRLDLAPGASALIAGAKDSVVVRVAATVNGEWRQLFNNVIELSAQEGRNILLIRGAQGGGVGLYPVPLWPAAPRMTTTAPDMK